MDPDPPREAGRLSRGPSEFTAPHAEGYVPLEGESVAEAITRFYPRAVPRIVALLVSTGATMEEASEAAHAAVVEAARSWNSIRTNHLAWCMTVAKRIWGRRKYSAEASFEDVPPDSPLLGDSKQDVFRRVEARLRLDETIGRLHLLTEREREVLDLHLAAFTTSEMAAQLNCADTTVRVHLANARRKLEGHEPDLHDGGPR